MPTLTEDRKRLVLRAHSNEQFVFIEAGDEPMCAAETDHIGLSVDTPAELDAMLERARKRASQDPRVTLVDKTIEDHHGVLMLHGGYIGFLLPLRIEVHPSPIGLQCVRSHLGVGPLG